MPRMDSLEMGELTDTALYILLALVEERHGYSIMQTIEELTEGKFALGPASLYTTIKKLASAELIKPTASGGDKRKTYGATEKGIQLLQNELDRRREIIKHAERVLNNG